MTVTPPRMRQTIMFDDYRNYLELSMHEYTDLVKLVNRLRPNGLFMEVGLYQLGSGRSVWLYVRGDLLSVDAASYRKGDVWVDPTVPVSQALSVWSGEQWLPMSDDGTLKPAQAMVPELEEIELRSDPDETRGLFTGGMLDGEVMDFFVAPWDGGDVDDYENGVPAQYISKYVDRAGGVHSELYTRGVSPWDDGPRWLFTLFEDRIV